MRLCVVALFVLIPPLAWSQDSSEFVTEEQVAQYQQAMLLGCTHAGQRNGDPPEQVEAFCTCMLETLRQRLSVSDWQRAYVHSAARDRRAEMAVLEPHLASVRSCRAR